MTFAAATVEELIDFEAQTRSDPAGVKEAKMRDRFGFTPARYQQLIGRILTDPARLTLATQHDPYTTARLIGQRNARINP